MLSKSGIHAVRALIVLAELPEGQYRGASSIAAQNDAPANYLGKLLQLLAKHGLVHSQKGLGGGFQLARDPAKISLYDIVSAIEDVGRWHNCILGKPNCSDANPCPVHGQWGPVRDTFLKLLKGTSVADLTP
jgi:Rrf2 family iron-sulfur cluster assembly transcriptional regulator